ncbi:MAG: UTP--glucose-1-phosphate uridylyltransferase [Clostridia bacterium]|nr:UTP--glucose-1-phosphate uridylyltransferase [Clostridia bacterium]
MLEPVIPIIKSTLNNIDYDMFYSIGAEAIKKGKLAVCTLAGGQGSRLGHKGPKGTFIVPFEKITSRSIFEIAAEKIKNAYKEFGIYTYWYIMTSKENDKETKDFFIDNNYFGIPKEKIIFFMQGEFPLIRENGEEIKDKEGNIVLAANGNGGIFKALEDEGIILHMKENNIDYICTCNVDNILVNPIDAVSFGIIVKNNADLCIKSIEKSNSDEKVGSIVLKDDKITVVEYIDMPKELTAIKNEEGSLIYSESHFGCNYIGLSLLEKISKQKLPIHEAHKKNDEYGEYIKKEMFIFDGFEMAEKPIVIRVLREDEFAPIKNKDGVDSPKTAILLYENKFYR